MTLRRNGILAKETTGASTIAYVQDSDAVVTSGNPTVSLLHEITAGDLLVAQIVSNSDTNITSITNGGTVAVIWTKSAASYYYTAEDVGIEVWYGYATASASSASFTAVNIGSGSDCRMDVAEFSGVKPSGLDQTVTQFGGGPDISTGRITPAQAGELFIGCVAYTGEWESGQFDLLDVGESLGAPSFTFGYAIAPSGNAEQEEIYWTQGYGSFFAGAMASFLPA